MYYYQTELGQFISNFEPHKNEENNMTWIPYPIEVCFEPDLQLAESILGCVKANCEGIFVKSCQSFQLI